MSPDVLADLPEVYTGAVYRYGWNFAKYWLSTLFYTLAKEPIVTHERLPNIYNSTTIQWL